MRLVKQTILYFKEGNSDKTYEIDLCAIDKDKFVVNFRYGRRGAQLKEGSKTPVPVSMPEAEKIFDSLETEKIQKGYTTNSDGISLIPAKPGFKLENLPPVSLEWQSSAPGREKAILQRLHDIVTKQQPANRTKWKLSRIVWKAGVYQIQAAAPYILHLFNSHDSMLQYSCCWALARSGNKAAVPALQQIFKSSPSKLLSQLAGAGLLNLVDGLEREQHLTHFLNSLPEAFKAAVNNRQPTVLETLAIERIDQTQTSYTWIEKLYLLSQDKKWIRPVVKKILNSIKLKAGYFKHIRAIYKWAELLNDFEILGLLSCRFEREPEQYTHFLTAAERKAEKPFVPYTDFAFSNKTKAYLHKRTLKTLETTGKTNNTDYVKLATALLISYDKTLDEKEAYTEQAYSWSNNRYERIELNFPANAHAIYLHKILNGKNEGLVLVAGNRFQQINPAVKKAKNTGDKHTGIVQFITGLFKRTKSVNQSAAIQPAVTPENNSPVPYLHLWNQVPQAYIQLLMDAQLQDIHQFAATHLQAHSSYTELMAKIDLSNAIRLISSPFPIPAEVGFNLINSRYPQGSKEIRLLLALLSSCYEKARETARRWVEMDTDLFIADGNFIVSLLFSVQDDSRHWAQQLLKNKFLSDSTKELIAGKAIAYLAGCTELTAPSNHIIKDGTATLLELCPNELTKLNNLVIADLIQHPNAEILLFGLQVLRLQQAASASNFLPPDFIASLLKHKYEPVRTQGISILNELPPGELKKQENIVLHACLSAYSDVRNAILPALQKLIESDPSFGSKAAMELMPFLLRKEKSEGLHADLSKLLCNQLSNYLPNANRETALNLLYSNYEAAQQTGLLILEKYTNPSELTVTQLVHLGSHENLSVREWCWAYFEKERARIIYEKESAVNLLNSKWKDSREFARNYFRQQFKETDWDADLLISLADSTNQETEAFARELITSNFQTENGELYLQKLSQHPREKMQLFVTNYLENYAADNSKKISELNFYFRSVLTRVNKGRIAKNRVLNFLGREGLKSAEAAKLVASILSDISATAAIEDKARCIKLLTDLKAIYAIEARLEIIPLPEKMAKN